jgi:hypothetical protein
MRVGQDIALVGVDDHAGPHTLGLSGLGLRLVRHLEETTEERIIQQRVLGHGLPAGDRDVHHRRGNLFEHVGYAGAFGIGQGLSLRGRARNKQQPKQHPRDEISGDYHG